MKLLQPLPLPLLPLLLLAQGAAACATAGADRAAAPPPGEDGPMIGLRTVKYAAPDLERARAWYTSALGIEPYFDQPFYVGYEVGGYELGLDPAGTPGGAGVVAYWGVADIDAEYARLLSLGAREHEAPHDVGEGIRVASVLDPFGNVFGIIYNPHFRGGR